MLRLKLSVLLMSLISLLPRPRYYTGWGIVFDRFLCLFYLFVYSFLSLFLCQQYYEKTAGPICMKLFSEGVE